MWTALRGPDNLSPSAKFALTDESTIARPVSWMHFWHSRRDLHDSTSRMCQTHVRNTCLGRANFWSALAVWAEQGDGSTIAWNPSSIECIDKLDHRHRSRRLRLQICARESDLNDRNDH